MKRIKVKALVEVEIDVCESILEFEEVGKNLDKLSPKETKAIFKIGCFDSSEYYEIGNIQDKKLKLFLTKFMKKKRNKSARLT